MSNKAKATGSSYERKQADYQKEQGFPVDRIVLHGNKDIGDLTPLFDSVQECKAHVKMNLGVWIKELLIEQKNLGVDRGWVIHRRIGKGRPEDQYVTMLHSTLMSLLKEIK